MPIFDYEIFQCAGYEGQIATAQPFMELLGSLPEVYNADTDIIPFGRVIVTAAATSNDDAILPSAAGQNILGISYLTENYEKDANGDPGYPLLCPVGYIRHGDIYVIPETAIVLGDPVFYRHTDEVAPATYDARGRMRNDASGGNADALPNARWLRASAAGEINIIRITTV